MASNNHQLLTQAKAQYHALMTGTAPRVVVDRDGSRVEYSAANKQLLYAYIQELEALLGCTPTLAVRGPANFLF